MCKFPRKKYVVYLVVFTLLYYAIISAVKAAWSAYGEIGAGYLITQAVLELLFWVAIVRISLCRLTDLTWPLALVSVFPLAWLFGKRNLIIYDLVINDGSGMEGQWLLFVPTLLSFMALVVLALLVFVPTKKTQNQEKA
jgi:hypothetical protein